MNVALFMIVLAIISLFTGFRVHFLPFKLYPFIFGTSALLIIPAIFFKKELFLRVTK
jgi:hypothetical protein